MTPEEEAAARRTVAWIRRASAEDIDEMIAVTMELQQRLLELQHRLALLPTDPPRDE